MRGTLLAMILTVAAALPAAAAPVATDTGTAELIAARTALVPGQAAQLALRLTVRPGWHSYWRNPGEGGLPTTLDWALPAGYSAGDIQWPVPQRLVSAPLVNYGYEGTVVLPVTVSVPASAKPGEAVTLAAHAGWLACKDICIPGDADVALTLPVAAQAADDPEGVGPIAAARAQLPMPARFPVSAMASGKRLTLHAALPAGAAPTEAHFLPYDAGAIDDAAPQSLTVGADGLTLALARGRLQLPATVGGVLLVTSGSGTDAFSVAAPAIAAPAAPDFGLVEAVGLALLGGILLNLMPCVFPVLSLKALSLAAETVRQRRGEALAYGAGVLASFAALAGLLLALRAGGAELGWGFQLQAPGFVAVLALVMVGIGLMLSGAVELGGGAVSALMGFGGTVAGRPGLVGAAATGALATAVATPCSAPFMGAALGFAVTQPPATALAVFLALGLGMALPMTLLGLVPALARRLPRPGPWMVRLKQVLAFPMYATAAWLVWVLAQEAGPGAVAAALAGIVLVGFAAWASGLRGRLAGAASGLAAAAAVTLAILVPVSGVPAADTAERFTPERLAAARADGRPVLINATAAWCITCLVNERVVLERSSVAAALSRHGVAYLKADWTRQDPAITQWLASFGRSGVPLYVLYPADPTAPPEVLPQILTEATLLDRLDRLPTRSAGTVAAQPRS